MTACLSILLLAFAQNVSFSIVSRSRNRSNLTYHLFAATASNGVWFLTFRQLVLAEMDWLLFVPYTLGTVAGSLLGVKVSMAIERWLGATSDGHLEAKPTPPEPKRYPATTFEEAVAFVARRIKADTVSAPGFHFAGGMAVRNDLGLWDRASPLHRHMLERFGLCHADDTGALISAAADAQVNGRYYDPAEDVERSKTHWRVRGIDPATMEPINQTA